MVKKGKAAPQKRQSLPPKDEAPPGKRARTQEAYSEKGDLQKEENPKAAWQKAAANLHQKSSHTQEGEAPLEIGSSQKEESPKTASQKATNHPGKKARTQKEQAPADERSAQNDDIVRAAEALRQMRGVFPKDGTFPQKKDVPRKGGSPQEETAQAAEASHQMKSGQTREGPDDKATLQVNPLSRTRGAAVQKGSLQVASLRALRVPQKAEAAPQEEAIQKGVKSQEATFKAREAQGKEVPTSNGTSQHREPANPQAPVAEDQCWDWMLVFGNAHYARDRRSFTTYRPLRQYCPTSMSRQVVFVAGVGTVELKVPSSPNTGSPVRTLILVNVLHIPSALCNGFSFNVWAQADGYFVGGKGASAGYDQQRVPYWYTRPFCGSEKLVLDGDPQGKSFLGGVPKVLSLFFTEELLKKIHEDEDAR